MVAVNDGVVTEVGKSKKLGRYMVLRDAYGNRFTYAKLGEVSDVYPVPKQNRLSPEDFKLVSPTASPSSQRRAARPASARAAPRLPPTDRARSNTEDARERLYAFPERSNNVDRADLTGQLDQLLKERFPGYESFKAYFSSVLRFDRKTMEMEPLDEGSKVIAGTVLGKIGKTDELAPHLHFGIRPAGRGDPQDRPEADPRRLEAARGDGDLPRRRQEPVPRGRLDRPGAADVEAAADPAGARRPAARGLLLRPRGHPDRPDRPPHPRAARVPRRARLPAHGHLAQVRARASTRLRATSRTTRRATPSTSPRSTASRCSETRAPARSPRRWSRT